MNNKVNRDRACASAWSQVMDTPLSGKFQLMTNVYGDLIPIIPCLYGPRDDSVWPLTMEDSRDGMDS